MVTTNSIQSENYIEPKWFWSVLAVGAWFFAWLLIRETSWYWNLLSVLGILAIGSVIGCRATIDPKERVVIEEVRIFQRKLLGKRIHPFASVQAIIFKHVSSEPDEWGVGLRLQNGQKILINSRFRGGSEKSPGRAAEEFAWKISCATDLPIEDVCTMGKTSHSKNRIL